jgi:hypothetical protein
VCSQGHLNPADSMAVSVLVRFVVPTNKGFNDEFASERVTHVVGALHISRTTSIPGPSIMTLGIGHADNSSSKDRSFVT